MASSSQRVQVDLLSAFTNTSVSLRSLSLSVSLHILHCLRPLRDKQLKALERVRSEEEERVQREIYQRETVLSGVMETVRAREQWHMTSR